LTLRASEAPVGIRDSTGDISLPDEVISADISSQESGDDIAEARRLNEARLSTLFFS